MTRLVRKLPLAAGTLLYLLTFLSCQNPLAPAGTDVDPSGGVGTLVVQINTSTAKSLLPPINMTPASFVVSGSGPDSGTFNQPGTSSPVVVPNLKYGSWTVTVDALNAAGTIIGRGQQVATILTGQNTPVSVTVKPLNGYGTLSLTVTWNSAAVGSPAIEAQLVPAGSGSTLNLSFSSSTVGSVTTATSSSSTIPTGYYTLVLQLKDSGTLVMGAVEAVRIVKDQVTSGSFDFQQVNSTGGQITVNITPEMSNPIAVTLNGQTAQITQGSSMTVTASVPAGTGNVVYAWYVNGEVKATGQSYTVASTRPAGYYRLDVTAFSADGKRAGSASHNFEITPPAQLTQADLIWNPNTETDLAGYKIYYGTASGQYVSVLDVGNQTSYTLAGLQTGQTYYISATAYNASGLESGHSNEVVFLGS
jgi:hypothetical protein